MLAMACGLNSLAMLSARRDKHSTSDAGISACVVALSSPFADGEELYTLEFLYLEKAVGRYNDPGPRLDLGSRPGPYTAPSAPGLDPARSCRTLCDPLSCSPLRLLHISSLPSRSRSTRYKYIQTTQTRTHHTHTNTPRAHTHTHHTHAQKKSERTTH